MKPLVIALIVAFPISSSFAAFEELDCGARSMAMGGAFCGLSDDCQAIQINPAGLAQMLSSQFSAFYTRGYSMAEHACANASYTQPIPAGTAGVLLSSFGRDPYQEFLLLLGYGYPFGKVSVGSSLRLMRVQIADYGSANSIGVDLGVLGEVSKGLNLGVSVRNLNRPEIAGSDLPSSLTVGLALSPARGLILCADVYKEFHHALETRFGFEYSLGKQLSLRSGFKTGPASFFTWGAGYRVGHLELGYGGSSHPALGLTHGLSVLLSFGPRTSFQVFRLSHLGE